MTEVEGSILVYALIYMIYIYCDDDIIRSDIMSLSGYLNLLALSLSPVVLFLPRA